MDLRHIIDKGIVAVRMQQQSGKVVYLIFKIFCHFCKHFFPGAFGVFQLIDDTPEVLRIRPRDQIILILKLTVKSC